VERKREYVSASDLSSGSAFQLAIVFVVPCALLFLIYYVCLRCPDSHKLFIKDNRDLCYRIRRHKKASVHDDVISMLPATCHNDDAPPEMTGSNVTESQDPIAPFLYLMRRQLPPLIEPLSFVASDGWFSSSDTSMTCLRPLEHATGGVFDSSLLGHKDKCGGDDDNASIESIEWMPQDYVEGLEQNGLPSLSY
jgi:hypothetical protein